ncbi:MAG: hypothetical protein ACREOQ_07485 [Gemmatimonadales bacterium]
MNLRVRIDRLILEGFALEGSERRAVGAALEAELALALSEAALSAGLQAATALDRIRAPDIPAVGRQARALGVQIGRAVGVSLTEPSANEQRGGT